MKNKIRRKLRNFAGNTAVIGTLLGAYLFVGAVMTCFRAIQEVAQNKILNETKKTYRATLKDYGHSMMAQTKGYLEYGDFEFENGNTIRIYDSQRVLQGKIFPNSRLPYNGIGKTYDLRTIGSEKVGHDLLEARLVK